MDFCQYCYDCITYVFCLSEPELEYIPVDPNEEEVILFSATSPEPCQPDCHDDFCLVNKDDIV